ncbi:YrdB family protein [Microbacterium sp. 18062]|uniref:YrdB family protein n=1 Tax=Microbacterium sp. 18062 TaxID=2681410 RepID=UPI001359AFB2
MTDPNAASPSPAANAGGGTSGSATLPAGTRRPLSAVEVLAFVCEIVAFGVLAIWGFAVWELPWNIVLGIATPVAAVLLWALFVSPRAVFAVHPFVRAIVELLVYAAATAALWSMGLTWVGIGFAVIAVAVGAVAGRRRFA